MFKHLVQPLCKIKSARETGLTRRITPHDGKIRQDQARLEIWAQATK